VMNFFRVGNRGKKTDRRRKKRSWKADLPLSNFFSFLLPISAAHAFQWAMSFAEDPSEAINDHDTE